MNPDYVSNLLILVALLLTSASATTEKGENGFVSSESTILNMIPDHLRFLLPVDSFDPTTALHDAKTLAFKLDRFLILHNFLFLSYRCDRDVRAYIEAQIHYLGALAHHCDNYSMDQTAHEECLREKNDHIRDNQWSMYVVDSFGKIEPGILAGNRFFWGSFSECRELVETKMDPKIRFKWEYFLASRFLTINHENSTYNVSVELGLCFPASCSEKDVEYVIYLAHMATGLDTSEPIFHKIESRKDERLTDHPDAMAAVIFCGVWLILLILASAYDSFIVEHEFFSKFMNLRKKFAFNNFVASFSLARNIRRVILLRQEEGTISCLHGIRVLTMCWIILAQTYSWATYYVNNMGTVVERLRHEYMMSTIISGTTAVNSFIILSGFLMAYSWFVETEKQAGRNIRSPVHWGFMWLRRYLRLTPVLMIFVFLETTLIGFLASGPIWTQDHPDKACPKNWWTNLLYINNLVGLDKRCLAHTWYLAVDMQLFTFVPLVLVPIFLAPVFGFVLAGALLAAAAILKAIAIIRTGYHTGSFAASDHLTQYIQNVVIRPEHCIGPYVVGVVLGYIMFRNRGKTIRLSHPIKWAIRCVAIGVNYAIVYSVFPYIGDKIKPSPILNGVSCGLSPILWGLTVAWLIFECQSGNGDVINKFLSLPIWQPFARLSYCAFLVHTSLILLWHAGSHAPLTFNSHLTMVYAFLGHLVLSYAVALVLHLAFEAPFRHLSNLLFDSRDNKHCPNHSSQPHQKSEKLDIPSFGIPFDWDRSIENVEQAGALDVPGFPTVNSQVALLHEQETA